MILYFECRININALLQTVSFFFGGGGGCRFNAARKVGLENEKGEKSNYVLMIQNSRNHYETKLEVLI